MREEVNALVSVETRYGKATTWLKVVTWLNNSGLAKKPLLNSANSGALMWNGIIVVYVRFCSRKQST